MATALTCDTVNDYLARNDTLFGPYIYEAMRESSPWVRLTPTEAFPEGTGYTHRNIRIEGITTGSNEGDWSAVTASNGSSINPLSAPTLTALQWGQSYTNWAPSYKGYITPCISLDDLKFDHMVTEQVSRVVEQLTQVTDEVLSNRYRHEHARLMPAISCRPGFGPSGISGTTDTTSAFNKSGVVPPTSTLHQSILDTLHTYLLRLGAGRPESAGGMDNGVPAIDLVCSKEVSDYLIRSSGVASLNNGIIDNFHFGNPDELLKPLGVTRVFRGWNHVIDVEIPRFNLVAGQMSRVLPFSMTSADSGNKRIFNTAYETAAYEYIYAKPRNAMSAAIIKDSTAKDIAGAAFEDHPYYYSMTFFWSNIKDNTTNILGKLGRWIGIAAQASHPMYPDRGMGIFAKRCYADQTFPACGCAV